MSTITFVLNKAPGSGPEVPGQIADGVHVVDCAGIVRPEVIHCKSVVFIVDIRTSSVSLAEGRKMMLAGNSR